MQTMELLHRLNASWKNLEKLVQWIEDMVQGGLGLLLKKKSWIW